MSFVGGDNQFLVVNSLLSVVVSSQVKVGIPQEGWSPPKKGSVHPQMAVTNFKDLCEKDNSYFDSTTLFGKYLDQKNALGIDFWSFS